MVLMRPSGPRDAIRRMMRCFTEPDPVITYRQIKKRARGRHV